MFELNPSFCPSLKQLLGKILFFVEETVNIVITILICDASRFTVAILVPDVDTKNGSLYIFIFKNYGL